MEIFNKILEILIAVLDGFSILVLLWGVLGAAKSFVVTRFTTKSKLEVIRENTIIKNSLGSYILLSLEILIAADIISTILNPNLNDIIILGATVLIRTIISFFLNKEIKDETEGNYAVNLSSLKDKSSKDKSKKD